MRPVIYVLSFLAVLGLGFWAYRAHYDTREALRDVSALNTEIAGLREALALQRAEWAYLNRPDRLRELASLNFDRLGLLPLEPTQFGDAANLSYPPAEEMFGRIDNSVMVIGEQTAEEDPL
ncbi:MAG: cell division protein FtsL [Rhodobacteraceae bacterium]|nr:cell division protein FtsL [Paracoccaceae bacterium]